MVPLSHISLREPGSEFDAYLRFSRASHEVQQAHPRANFRVLREKKSVNELFSRSPAKFPIKFFTYPIR